MARALVANHRRRRHRRRRRRRRLALAIAVAIVVVADGCGPKSHNHEFGECAQILLLAAPFK